MSCRLLVASVVVLAASISASPVAGQSSPLEPGLTLRIYDIGRALDRLAPLRADQTPNVDRRLDVLDLTDDEFGGPGQHFFVEASGYLMIEQPGVCGFSLSSDDGSRLRIDDTVVIINDGLHADVAKEGEIRLDAGLHPFGIDMFQNEGGAALSLSWRTPGSEEFVIVPASAYRTEQGVTRVVSPGRKVLLDGREHFKPGDGLPLEDVHPGWVIEDLRPEGFEPQVGGMDFLPDGRLVLSDFQPVNNGVYREAPNGTIWILDNVIGGDRSTITADQIADGFHDPCGIVVVNGDIYISHRPGIERLRDLDGDGTFETRETFAEPWVGDNYHHFSFGLQHHDGWIYGTLSTSIYFDNTMEADDVRGTVVSMNGPNPPNRGSCYRINIETREVEFLAGGFRTPNGLLVTDEGEIFVADNQGAWLPSSKLMHVKPGRFFGHYNGRAASARHPEGGNPSVNVDQPVSLPVVWLPQNEVANSPTTPLVIPDGPFAGQLLMSELTMGGIRRICMEEINGELQGAVFRHSQGFEGGINRLIWGPDGCLYAGMIGADGNWTWRGTQFGLQRMRPTGDDVFEMHSVLVTPTGFVVRFTQPADPDWLRDPSNYAISKWRYFDTAEYGGPKLDEQRLAVSRATPSQTGDAVALTIPGLREGCVVRIRLDPKSARGESLWSKEAWYSLNSIPTTSSDRNASAVTPLQRGSLGHFSEPRGAWVMVADVLQDEDDGRRLTGDGHGAILWNGPEGGTNDIVTNFDHGDVEAHIEFMVPEGSNSGVYFMGRYEVQVLDSYGKDKIQHSDCGGVYQRWDSSRGSGNEGYEGVPPRVNASRAPGEWQSFDVIFRAPRFSATGRKIANARFERVEHNGIVIHEDIELAGPTRGGYEGEVPFGPLRLQGDHGPVAYRNISLRLLSRPTTIDMPAKSELRDFDVLVFSKTAGFRHSSIPDGIARLKLMGLKHGFKVHDTEDATAFTEETLKDFDVIVFLSTTGDILDDDQQAAFEAWYCAGGGYVGVHAAADTEYDWPWYGELVGAYFQSHPAVQPARVVVEDLDHPATRHLSRAWVRTDEWYDYRAQPHKDCRVLMRLDENTYKGGAMGASHPTAWCHEFDGGRAFYTGGGHTSAAFDELDFQQHLLGAILWAGGKAD